MTLGEKASYIKGMLEGLDLDKEKKENKILISVVELLEEMADSVLDLENRVDDIDDRTEDMWGKLDEISCDMCECKGEGGHNHCHGDHECEGSDDFFYEIQCPACSTTICLSETAVLEKDITCPNCGQEIEIDLENSDLGSTDSDTDKKSSDSDRDSSDN